MMSVKERIYGRKLLGMLIKYKLALFDDKEGGIEVKPASQHIIDSYKKLLSEDVELLR
tara:strand:+ start:440 stop:613 length:174 start_codon:yes stop_codon:yes gene_type:complete